MPGQYHLNVSVYPVQPFANFGDGMMGILRVKEAQAAELHGEKGVRTAQG